MKRTFERIGFMLVGAVLVCTSYFVGKTEKDADARITTLEDVKITGTLFVNDTIIIGNPFKEPGNSISLKVDEIGPRISLDYHYDEAKNHRDASLFLLAGEGANGKASASITLEDKFGNTLTGLSYLGWYEKE